MKSPQTTFRLNIVTFLLIFAPVNVKAQSEIIDSLQLSINQAQHDSIKVNSYIAWDNLIYMSDGDLDLTINKKIDSICRAKLTSQLVDKEQQFFLASRAKALNIIGLGMGNRGNYPGAIDCYNQSLEIRERIGDAMGIATCLNNLGSIYMMQNDFENANKYYTRSFAINDSVGYMIGMANALNNLGLTYESTEKFELAKKYYQMSYEVHDSIGNLKGTSYTLNNMGVIYRRAEKFDTAMALFERSLEIREELGDNTGIANSLNNMGKTYYSLGDYPAARKALQTALKTSLTHNVLLEKRNAAEMLWRIFKLENRHKDALDMHEIYVEARDSMLGEDVKREIYKKEYLFKYQKQSLTDSLNYVRKEAVLSEKNEKQKLRIGAMAAILILLAGTSLAIYKGKKRSDELLLNILPYETAQELKQKGTAEAKLINNVTVLFTDFKGFTEISENIGAKELVYDLNFCFSEFDRIMEKYGIEKIKTIGDAYMAACGLPMEDPDHAEKVVRAAFEIRDFVEKGKRKKIEQGLPFFEVRIGIHSGPVVAGIVGIKKFQYDIWGDTVNIASRMESTSEVGMVNISEPTYRLVKDEFSFKHRGEIEAKGKGKIKMYFVTEQA